MIGKFEKALWKALIKHYDTLRFPKDVPNGLYASSILEVVLKAKEEAKKNILSDIKTLDIPKGKNIVLEIIEKEL